CRALRWQPAGGPDHPLRRPLEGFEREVQKFAQSQSYSRRPPSRRRPVRRPRRTKRTAVRFHFPETVRSWRSLATCPVALTLYCAAAILPFSSTTNVERIHSTL